MHFRKRARGRARCSRSVWTMCARLDWANSLEIQDSFGDLEKWNLFNRPYSTGDCACLDRWLAMERPIGMCRRTFPVDLHTWLMKSVNFILLNLDRLLECFVPAKSIVDFSVGHSPFTQAPSVTSFARNSRLRTCVRVHLLPYRTHTHIHTSYSLQFAWRLPICLSFVYLYSLDCLFSSIVNKKKECIGQVR